MASSSAAADSTPDTLVQAAAVGRAVFDSVVSSDQLKTPRLRNIQRAPTSFADAQAAIHARDEEHRRLEAQRKEASKSKSTPEPQGPPNPNPGVSIGSVQEASAFWLFVNDYYRDVGYDDLAFLVPPCRDISQDDAFYVPPLGRNKLAAPKGGLSARNKAPSKSSQLFVPDTATDDPERVCNGQPSAFQDASDQLQMLSMGPAWADSLVTACGPDGRRINPMVQGCLDTELRDMTQVLTQLGLLSDQPVDTAAAKQQLAALSSHAGQYLDECQPLPPLHQLPASIDDRTEVEGVLQAVAEMVGAACIEPDQPLEPLPKQVPTVLGMVPLFRQAATGLTPVPSQQPGYGAASKAPQSAQPPLPAQVAVEPQGVAGLLQASAPAAAPVAAAQAGTPAPALAQVTEQATVAAPAAEAQAPAQPSAAAEGPAEALSQGRAAQAAPDKPAVDASQPSQPSQPDTQTDMQVDAQRPAADSTDPTAAAAQGTAVQAAGTAEATASAATAEQSEQPEQPAAPAADASAAGTSAADSQPAAQVDTVAPATAPAPAEAPAVQPSQPAETAAPSQSAQPATGMDVDGQAAAAASEPAPVASQLPAAPSPAPMSAAGPAAAPEPATAQPGPTTAAAAAATPAAVAVQASVPAPAPAPELAQPAASALALVPAPEPAAAAAAEPAASAEQPKPAELYTGDMTEQGDYLHPWTQLLLARPPTLYVQNPIVQGPIEDTDIDIGDLGAPSGVGAGAAPLATKTPGTGNASTKRGRPTSKMLAARAAAAAKAAALTTSTGGALPTESQGTPIPATSQCDSQAGAAGAAALDAGTATSSLVKAEGTEDGLLGLPRVGPTPSTAPPAYPSNSLAAGRSKRGGATRPKLPSLGGAAAPPGAAFGRMSGGGALRAAMRSGEQSIRPLVAAVGACCAAGGPEEGLDEQWGVLESQSALISAAPDDEIMGEIMALQSELLQQVAINKRRAAEVLEKAVADIPLQEQKQDENRRLEGEIRAYLQRKAEIKRNQKRELLQQKRAQRASFDGLIQAMVGDGPRGGPRSKLGGPGGEGGEGGDGTGVGESRELTPDGGAAQDQLAAYGPIIDIYADRHEDDEEALCVVCGDGSSHEGNEILFCERCDIAVHQDCYGLPFIPEGEWLCFPCLEYERTLRQQGKHQSDIRPQRWEMAARGLTHQDLGGGSYVADCALCPVKRGAYKRTIDGKDFVHLVCALWHPETDVLPGMANEVVTGVQNIKGERLTTPCEVCKQTHGAVIKCAQPNCTHHFHPLCGRRIGNYLSAKHNQTGTKMLYRAYCHIHSPPLIAKDTLPEAMRPYQAPIDLRRDTIRKDMSGGTGRARRPAPGPFVTDMLEGEEALDQVLGDAGDWSYNPHSKSKHKPPSKTNPSANKAGAGRGSPAARPASARQAGRPPPPLPPHVPRSKQAKAAGAVQQGVGVGQVGPVGLVPEELYLEEVLLGEVQSPLESELEQLQNVRFELDILRNMLTQVQKREKQKRHLAREVATLELARKQDPQRALAALTELHGPNPLADIPPNPGNAAFTDADAWLAANKPGGFQVNLNFNFQDSPSFALNSPLSNPLFAFGGIGGVGGLWQMGPPLSNGPSRAGSEGPSAATAAAGAFMPAPPPMAPPPPPPAAGGKKKGGAAAAAAAAAVAGAPPVPMPPPPAAGGKRKRGDAASTAGGVGMFPEMPPPPPLGATDMFPTNNYPLMQPIAPPPPAPPPAAVKGPPKKKQKGGAAAAAAAAANAAAVPDQTFLPPLPVDNGMAGYGSFAVPPPPQQAAVPPPPPPQPPAEKGKKAKGGKKAQVAVPPPPPPQPPPSTAGQPGIVAPPPPPAPPGGRGKAQLPPISASQAGYTSTVLAPPPPPVQQPAAGGSTRSTRGKGGSRGAAAQAAPASPAFAPPPEPPAAPAPAPSVTRSESEAGSTGVSGRRQRQPSTRAAAAASGASSKPPTQNARTRRSGAQAQASAASLATGASTDLNLEAIAAARATPSPMTADEFALMASLQDDNGDGFGGMVPSASDANLLQQMQAMEDTFNGQGGQGFNGSYSEMPSFMSGLSGQDDLAPTGRGSTPVVQVPAPAPPAPQQGQRRSTRQRG